MIPYVLLTVALVQQLSTNVEGQAVAWDDWWTYEGITGPQFWGLVNSDWVMCKDGKMQSPINFRANQILYDPNLIPINFDSDTDKMNGTLLNTGHDLTFQVDDRNRVNLTGGPLSYLYRLQELRLHYGSIDSQGSEHSVDGYSFPGELQLLFYNYDLYGDLAEATKGTSGLAIISLFIQIGNSTNPELDKLLWSDRLQNVTYKGSAARVEDFNLTNLFPTTPHYMTYQGSLTSPDCAETVTWIVMNKPVYISRKKMNQLRNLWQNTMGQKETPLADNFRPTSNLNSRTIRTNINFTTKDKMGKPCPTMKSKKAYQTNSWLVKPTS
ncbi:carbonic anhydrase-related protein 10-like isoform X2 [Branchiostoma floridae x Branchiostoma japonicum]